MTNLWVVFISGLTAGGLTCLAVQGGLLAAVIASNGEDDSKLDNSRIRMLLPTLAFLVTKLVAYTVLGFILGMFGGVIGLNQTAQNVMQLVAGLYMIMIALNLLNIHPIFRYVVIQPPKFITRRVKSVARRKNLFGPAVLGVMTVFIPCGTTLAMEALAISSASPIAGGLIMAVFVLGTMPLFLGVGWLTELLGENFRLKFYRVAAIAVIYLGITSVSGTLVASGLIATDQEATIQKLYSEASPVQSAEIMVTSNGYAPKYLKVKKDEAVTLKLVGKNAYSCASAFRIPALGISKNLQPNETYEVIFTPKETGRLVFTCSMGMYSGVIDVI